MSQYAKGVIVMPQKSSDNINMANKCWWCLEEFDEDDELIFRDNKIYHKHCSEEMTEEKEEKVIKENYPFLEIRQIQCIINTSYTNQFHKFDNFDWVILLQKQLEMTVHGLNTQVEVMDFIRNHYKENEGNWNIDSIFYKSEKYSYNISFIVTLEKIDETTS